MKSDAKWQVDYNHQKHFQKIQTAKSTLDTGIQKKKRANDRDKRPDRRVDVKERPDDYPEYDSHGNNSDFTEREKEDLNKIPLYPLLREFGLQQYTKELVSRGFGYYTDGLCLLDEGDFSTLLKTLKVLPGHGERFRQLRSELSLEVLERHRINTKRKEEEDRHTMERKLDNTRRLQNGSKYSSTAPSHDFSKKITSKYAHASRIKGRKRSHRNWLRLFCRLC